MVLKKRRYFLFLIVLFFISVIFSIYLNGKNNDDQPEYGGETQSISIPQSQVKIGTKIDSYKGVIVYSNGKDYTASYGLSYSEDKYYYGLKWQCTEFVKRFYYKVYNHKMPDGAGNAKYYFNTMLEQGEFNTQRGLYQYKNGGDVKPKEDDLIVFTDGKYGHVAIISRIGVDWLEVVQQNSELSRKRYKLTKINNKYYVDGDRKPAGWLRLREYS
jgi:surface antigen